MAKTRVRVKTEAQLERIRELGRLRYIKNRAIIKKRGKLWRASHRDVIRERKRKWASSPSGKASATRWYYKSPLAMRNLYMASARKRGKVFRISKAAWLRLTQMPCAYCGIKPDKARIGLDRIDNSRGYLIDNVTPCCCACNQMKSDRSVSEFINHIMEIANHANAKS